MSDLSDVFKLSLAERLQLVEDLWDSIAAESENHPPPTDEQRELIDRRLADHERDPSSSLEWPEVRARLWAKVR